MFLSRKKYRSELTEAEKEIPSFDVTRHERCLSCGTLGIDRFVCKSNMKIWTGDVTKRERNGLAFYKIKDDKGEFIGNPLCDHANFMQTVQDESKFIVRTSNIAFYLCSTESSDNTHTKFDFTDPKYCTPCDKFDPENDESVKGEESKVISESSSLETSSSESNNNEKGKDNNTTTTTTTETKQEEQSGIMTRAKKLQILQETYKDWLE